MKSPLLPGCGLLACLVLSAAAADKPPEAPAPEPTRSIQYDVKNLQEMTLYRITGISEGENLPIGGNILLLGHYRRLQTVNFLTGEPHEVFAFESKDPGNSPTLKALKAAGPNNPLVITTHTEGHRDTVSTIAPYTLRDGEDRPNIFLFVEAQSTSLGNDPVLALKLYKVGKFAAVRLPNIKANTPASEPDPKLAEAVTHLKPGEMVEVETTGLPGVPVLKKISAFPSTQTGTLVKTAVEEVDGAKVPAAQITSEGEDKTFLLPGKPVGKDRWAPDSQIDRALKACKPGTPVTFRAYQQGDHLWLREILPTPPSIFNAK
jgi:hypothetical protein